MKDQESKGLTEEDRAWREEYQDLCQNRIPADSDNLQNIFTPYSLWEQIIDKAVSFQEDLLTNPEKKLFAGNFGAAMVLMEKGVPANRITSITDCQEKIDFIKTGAQMGRYSGINLFMGSFLDWELEGENMKKFDFCVMNPPYQGIQIISDKNHKQKRRNGLILWDKFIHKAFDIVKPNGFVCSINPSKWRKPADPLWEKISKCQIHYLEIHDENDGQKTFGASTRYDWYIVQNSPVAKKTVVVDQNKEMISLDLRKVSFIPNYMMADVWSLLAKEDEEKVTVLSDYNYSLYETRKSELSRIKDKTHVYPCIYLINRQNEATLFYSTYNNRGHFGVPKVIFSAGATGFLIDKNGEYGLTQFAKGIVDDKKILPFIYKAIQTKKFQEIIKACSMSRCEIDRDLLRLFRRDFWKNFVDENGSEK